ncbi:hypothetical protein J4734_08965 [Klebsiella pneumoniae]|uniref:Uncharacterized protein n=1 Tax=Klebsiella pneumoniae TaxID=573 RepID=A0A939NR37_KLEPN|nr:hypothetical protein [Klebsiella pneumoniae]
MAAKLREQLPGIIFQHKQSLRARQSERSVADGRSKTYLSGMLFLWQDIKDVTALRFPVKQFKQAYRKEGCSIEDEGGIGVHNYLR